MSSSIFEPGITSARPLVALRSTISLARQCHGSAMLSPFHELTLRTYAPLAFLSSLHRFANDRPHDTGARRPDLAIGGRGRDAHLVVYESWLHPPPKRHLAIDHQRGDEIRAPPPPPR